jgi:hypothetical protein
MGNWTAKEPRKVKTMKELVKLRPRIIEAIRDLHKRNITCARLKPEDFEYDIEDDTKELKAQLHGAIIWTRYPPLLFRFVDLEQWLSSTDIIALGEKLSSSTYRLLCARNAFTVAAAWWHLRAECDWNIWKSTAAVVLAIEPVVTKLVRSEDIAAGLPDCDLYEQLATDEEKHTFLNFTTPAEALFYAFKQGAKYKKSKRRAFIRIFWPVFVFQSSEEFIVEVSTWSEGDLSSLLAKSQ